MKQADVVKEARALIDEEPALDGSAGRVHVFGPKEGGKLLRDEAKCSSKRGPCARVVFHPRSVALTTGGWTCASCGETTVTVRMPVTH